MRKRIFQGELGPIALPDLLTFLSMIRKTGELTLTSKGKSKKLFFETGEVMFATSNDRNDSLGTFLVQNGIITEPENLESLQKVDSEHRQGKVLVQMGLLRPKDLWWAVRTQVLDIVYSVFAWKEGRYDFHETEAMLDEKIALTMSTTNIIMEGVRRLDEWQDILARIPSQNVVLEKGKDVDREGVELTKEEAGLVALVDGEHTVQDLIREGGLGQFETNKLLNSLLIAEVVRVCSGTDRSALEHDDSEALKHVIGVYNRIFHNIYQSVDGKEDDASMSEVFNQFFESMTEMQEDLFEGVLFRDDGFLDEGGLLANVADLPAKDRARTLDMGLNDILSFQLFEVLQQLTPEGKAGIYKMVEKEKDRLV